MRSSAAEGEQAIAPARGSWRALLPADAVGAIASVAIILAGWQFAASYGRVHAYLLPQPITVLREVGADLLSPIFYKEIGLSIYRALAAFGLATIIGVALGLSMRASRVMNWFLSPFVSFGLPLPKVALLPVFIVWFGLFDLSKIALTTFSAVFVVVIATLNAATKVETALIWSARNFGGGRLRVLTDVLLPGSLPGIYTGLQVALPICLVVTFVGEMVMGGVGLGARMIIDARNADSPAVFAGIIEIAIVGNVLIGTMQLLRRRVLYWI